MSNRIVFRRYMPEHRAALAEIIRGAWHYDEFCTPRTAKRLSRLYLDSCLAGQTFTRVALDGERPVGIIMVRNRDGFRYTWLAKLRVAFSAAMLCLTREGRQITAAFAGAEDVDRELLKKSPGDYRGEVAFFAVDEDYRGYGIGKRLFNSAMLYMKRENIRSFYLFTDTSCNYKFYEHVGMTRRGEEIYTFNEAGVRERLNMFIYDGKVI